MKFYFRQKETSSILQESLSIQTNGYTVLLKESKDLDHKYATLLEKYEQELMEYRSKYESTSKPFQELRAIKVEFKKLNIKKMVLEEDYKAKKFAKKQYSDIQNQILQAYIIKLAKIVVSERAAELIDMELKEEKQKEEMLLQEYRTLKSTRKDVQCLIKQLVLMIYLFSNAKRKNRFLKQRRYHFE